MDSCDVDFYHSHKLMSELPQLFNRIKINIFGEAGTLLNVTEIKWEDTSRKSMTAEVLMICFFCIVLVLSIVGTLITVIQHLFKTQANNKRRSPNKDLLDYKKRHQEYAIYRNQRRYSSKDLFSVDIKQYSYPREWYEKYENFLNCFCLLTNGKKLLNITPANGDLPCLHGLRFFTQVCIIICHIAGQLFYTAIRDFKDHVMIHDTWIFPIGLLCVFHSVDTFFLLSGFLNAYSFFQNTTTNKRKSWLHFYAHRFIRITPMYMIILGFYTIIFPYVGSNSLWSTYPGEQICKKHWWRNLLYISNLWPISEMCMTWSWFLSNDMQFFVISPLFLGPLLRWPMLGNSLLVMFLGATISTNFSITYLFNLPNFFLHLHKHLQHKSTFNAYMEKIYEYYDQLYIRPYMRIGPYVIGVGMAYCLFKRNQKNQIKINSLALYCGWAISTCFIIFCIFGVSRTKPSLLEASLYNALNQICFAMAVAWVLFVCISGKGGVINRFLSCKMLIPLSRLSYCAYLIHPMLMFGFVISLDAPLEFSYRALAVPVCCLTAGSFVVALIVHLTLESPIIRIMKLIFSI